MSDYTFAAEQLEAAKTCKSPEELVAKAMEQGIDISPERAAAFLNQQAEKSGEVADEELDNVAGGGCGDPSELETKWAAEAAAEGRPVKVKKYLARDTCPECGKLASVYAARSADVQHYDSSGNRTNIYHVEYYDCKCYSGPCKRTFAMIRE